MPRNKIQDLRNHLFEVIEKLQDGEMQIETAKTIAEVAQVMVNSAKVEVDFMRLTNGTGTGFIPIDEETRPPVEPPKEAKITSTKNTLKLFGT